MLRDISVNDARADIACQRGGRADRPLNAMVQVKGVLGSGGTTLQAMDIEFRRLHPRPRPYTGALNLPELGMSAAHSFHPDRKPDESPAQKVLSAATAALVVAVACIAMFLPPLVDHTVDSVLRVVAVALTLAVALLLHWVFVGIAAGRLDRSVAGWVALSCLLFPVGSAAALILLGWFSNEAKTPAVA